MKLHWTRSEILGKRLYWLVDIQFAGTTVRLSTHHLVIPSDDGDLRYTGTCEPITVSEEVALFALAASPVSVGVTAYWPINVAALVARGHALGGCVAEISQIVEGADYADRRIVLRGRVVDPEYGEHQGGRSFVNLSVEENIYSDPAEVPPVGWTVGEGRFTGVAGAALLSAEDVVPYPIALGYPGRDPQSLAGWVTGAGAPWISRSTDHRFILVSYGHVGAADIPDLGQTGVPVWLNTDADPAGAPFIVRAGYDDAGVPISYIDDSSGGSYSAGYEGLEDTDVPVQVFQLGVSDQVEVFSGWPEGGGVRGRDGRVVRKAGAVLEFLLDFASVPIDRGAFAAAAGELAAFNIDVGLDARCRLWEFLGERLLPLLPVSICSGPAGYFPIVWKPDASAADALAHLDADVDPRIEVAEIVSVDTAQVANDLTLRYGYSRRGEEFLYEARLGAEYVPATNRARAQFVEGPETAAPQRITVEALFPGLDYHGFLVRLVAGAGPVNIVSNATTSTATLDYVSGASTTQDLTVEIRTDSLVTCAFSSAAVTWDSAFVVDDEQALILVDNAVLPHPLCAASQAILRDDTRRDAGVRPWSMDSPLICDKASAYAVLTWRAAAFALPRRRLVVRVPMNMWGWLKRGNVIEFSHEGFAFDRQLALIEAMEWGSNDDLVLGLAFIENPTRDAYAAA